MVTDDVQNPAELDAFWGAVNEVASSRGGGFIGKIDMGFAWKVFVNKESGLTQTESMFPYDITSDRKVNDANSSKAKALANKFVVDHSLEKDPYMVFYIVLYKDSIIGREVSWKQDKTQYMFPSERAYAELIIPHLQKATTEVGEKRFGTWWAKVSWKENPDQSRAKMRNKLDSDGNIIVNENGEPEQELEKLLVMYVEKLFKTKEDAMAAAGGVAEIQVATEEKVEVVMPDGYDAETWEMTKKEIRQLYTSGTPLPKISKNFDLPVSQVGAIVADLRK